MALRSEGTGCCSHQLPATARTSLCTPKQGAHPSPDPKPTCFSSKSTCRVSSMRFLLMCLMATTLPWGAREGEEVSARWADLGRRGRCQHPIGWGCSQGGAPQQGWGVLGGELSSPFAALTLKCPVLAKIWYLPWVVIREP